MTTLEEDYKFVCDKLADVIREGHFTCAKCHRPLSGESLNRIDVEGQRVLYICPNEECYNHDRVGYRTFRGLKINLPTDGIPASLHDIKAPPPPSPEEVEWQDEDETSLESGSPSGKKKMDDDIEEEEEDEEDDEESEI